MTKIRLTRTIVYEYTPDPHNYPEGSTIEEIAESDATVEGLTQIFKDKLSDKVTYKILKGECS